MLYGETVSLSDSEQLLGLVLDRKLHRSLNTQSITMNPGTALYCWGLISLNWGLISLCINVTPDSFSILEICTD